MQKIILFLFTIILLSLTTSCEKEEKIIDQNQNNEIIDNLENFRYPMKVGNKWIYKHRIIIKSYENETDSIPFVIDTIYKSQKIEVEKKEIVKDSIEAFKVSAVMDDSLYYSIQYYTNEDDGLFCHAYYINKDFVFPKEDKNTIYQDLIKQVHCLSNGISSKLMYSDDSLFYDNPPAMSFPYPIENDTCWSLRENPYFTTFKECTGKELVNTAYGTTECVKFEYSYSGSYIDKVESLTDYIGQKGFIKRELSINRLSIADHQGNIFAFVEVSELIELIETNVD